MCGIAGLIHRRKTGDVGTEMTNMLKSLKHRGPDSTGFALYGQPKGNELVLRFKVAEQDEMSKGFDIRQQVKDRRAEVDRAVRGSAASLCWMVDGNNSRGGDSRNAVPDAVSGTCLFSGIVDHYVAAHRQLPFVYGPGRDKCLGLYRAPARDIRRPSGGYDH